MADEDDLNPTTNHHTPHSLSLSPSPSLSPPQFSHLITKIAVAQICKSFGFNGAQSSALDSLTRIAALYIQSLASRASTRAAVFGGRTECNLFDVVHALEDLHLPAGFPGAGDVSGPPLLKSATLKELSLFINVIDEVPFARRIPRREPAPESVVFPPMSRGSVRKGPEVPRWLPEFPDVVVEEPKRVSKREALWEEETFLYQPPPPLVLTTVTEEEKKKKRNLGFLLQGRRERVKFRVGVKNGKSGMDDDLELRNGVCRGGKRVCLANRVNKKFLDEDEDEDEDEAIEYGNGKS